jgi:hypothetical protein
MSIHISVKGLANFMKSSSAVQRTLLKNHKFPFDSQGKKRPQIVRYSEARAAIHRYHQSGNEIGVLISAIERLVKKSMEGLAKDVTRLDDNVRAIKTYMAHFSTNKFEVLPNPKPKYTHGQVIVSATPDLYVKEGSKKRLIRLDFNAKKPDEEVVDIILKVMHQAAEEAHLGISPTDVVYLDVSRQTQYLGKKLNSRLKKEIDAACDTIADIWPAIKLK